MDSTTPLPSWSQITGTEVLPNVKEVRPGTGAIIMGHHDDQTSLRDPQISGNNPALGLEEKKEGAPELFQTFKISLAFTYDQVSLFQNLLKLGEHCS